MDLPLPTLAASLDCDPQPLFSAVLAAVNGGIDGGGNGGGIIATTTAATIVLNDHLQPTFVNNNGNLFLDHQQTNQSETFGGSAFELFTLLCMIGINLAVVLGNALVILSVFVYGKLRTVTNFFIVSLAVADLMLGIMVLPYSLTQEVANAWYFGEIWCMGWLVVDVWLSTASILNLVAISLDRYLAITRPIQYRSLMTARRAKMLIATAWTVSFLICMPPLLTGNQSGYGLVQVGGGGAGAGTGAAAGVGKKMSEPTTLSSPSLQINKSVLTNLTAEAYWTNKNHLLLIRTNEKSKKNAFTSADKLNPSNVVDWSSRSASTSTHRTHLFVRRRKSSSTPVSVTKLPPTILDWTNGNLLTSEQQRSQVDSMFTQTPSTSETDYEQTPDYVDYGEMNNISEEVFDNSAIPNLLPSSSSSSSSSSSVSSSSQTKSRTPSWQKTTQKSTTKTEQTRLPPCKPNQTLSAELLRMYSQRVAANHSTAMECILFDSRGYVTYSALGSFFIPMMVMIFFYWRIYKVASETTRALNRGYISGKPIQTTTGSSGGVTGGTTGSGSSYSGNGDREVKMTLRVHRGCLTKEEPPDNATQKRLSARSMMVTASRGSATSGGGSTAAQLLPTSDASNSHSKSLKCVRRVVDFCRIMGDKQNTITRTQSEQKIEMRPLRSPRLSGEDQMPSMGGRGEVEVHRVGNGTQKQQTKPMPMVIRSSPEHSKDETNEEVQDISSLTATKSANGSTDSKKLSGKTIRQSTRSAATSISPAGSRKCSTPSNGSAVTLTITPANTSGPKSPSKPPLGSWSRGRAGASGTGRFQAKRFLAETKAAKTVGIIVGGFIFCWFPFFCVYLTRGFCDDKNCIPDKLLTFFTWAGYINSALNPLIYAFFSKEFAKAFKNIVCKCRYGEETGVSSLIRQIHLPNLFDEEDG